MEDNVQMLNEQATSAIEKGDQNRATSNSTLRALAGWTGAIASILGITSVLGLSFDSSSIGDLARPDLKAVVTFGLIAIGAAVLGTVVAILANAAWNSEPELPEPEEITPTTIKQVNEHFARQQNRKKWALIASVALVLLAIGSAGCATAFAALGAEKPVTQDNRLMVYEDEPGTPAGTICGSLLINPDGQVMFNAAGAARTDLTPVPDVAALPVTGDCDTSP